MKTINSLWLLFGFIVLWGCSQKVPPLDTTSIKVEPIIADHTSTNLVQIPIKFIEKAKSDFRIMYEHTSHGSQITSGMKELMIENSLYAFGSSRSKNVLTLYDDEGENGDLNIPTRSEWEIYTRHVLDHWGDVNIVIWAWGWGVSHGNEKDIQLYLDLMQGLENDYPGIVFVYMTGHLDGAGEEGTAHKNNEMIRKFTRDNNKVLYDFGDIERFDPDGNDFLGKYVSGTCKYKGDNGEQGNWAEEWCQNNLEHCKEYFCAHSHPLNCDLKSSAFWWMIARIAGWNP